MELREYQNISIENILKGIKDKKLSQLLVLPTGTGKTVIFSNLVKRLKLKTLVISNTNNLKKQTQNVCDKIAPGYVESHTIQYIYRHIFKKSDFLDHDMLIVDEAHHAASDSYKEIIDKFRKDKKFILGCTATPFRSDAKSIYSIFPHLCYEAKIVDMIDSGYLTDIRGLRIKSNISLEGIRVTRGDFNLGQLSAIVNTENRNELILSFFKEFISDKKTLIFCVDINHCETLTKLFKQNDILCESVHGYVSRNEINYRLQDFKNGDLKVITTCQLLTEGFDEPSIEALIMARPTKSCGLYIQMIGRGLRKFEGKKECIVCEFTDNCHNICDFSTLASYNISQDNKRLATDREYSIRELTGSFAYRPLGEDIVIHEEDFVNKYNKNQKMTDYQRNLLISLGVKFIEPISYEIAELLIKNHMIRKKHGPY